MSEDPDQPTNEPTEADVDEVLAEAKGDPREAIRMLLRDIATLARDADAKVSHGYVRGRVVRFAAR